MTKKQIPTVAKVREMINGSQFSSWLKCITYDKISLENKNIAKICYGNGKYIISMLNSILYSSDAKNWTSIDTDYTILELHYINNKFVGYYDKSDQTTGGFIYSDDGINWTKSTSASLGGGFISYGNNIYVATVYLSSNNFDIYKSTDGINWTKQSYEINERVYGICFGNNKFVAISTKNIYWSLNGEDWNKITTEASSMQKISYINNEFVIYDKSRKMILTSRDGLTIDNAYSTNLPLYTLNNEPIQYKYGLYFIGFQDGGIYYSNNYINWTKLETPSNYTYAFCFCEDKLVISVEISGKYYILNNDISFDKFPTIDYVKQMIYPVGSIYMSVNNTDPSTFIGGTWESLTSPITDSYAWKRTAL